MKYKLPPNVIDIQEVFLNHHPSPQKFRRPGLFSKQWQGIRLFHETLAQQNADEAVEMLQSIFEPNTVRPDISELIYSEEAWRSLLERYYAHSPTSAFLDYFWTFRSTHLPLFTLSDIVFPRAKLYHAVSTGYAGFAAALAKLQTGHPMLITEHGIYTRERDMEIALSSSIDIPPADPYRPDPENGVFRDWWMGMFRFMSRFAYQAADNIISITKSNQEYQLRDGADRAKLRLISNGIDVERFKNLPTGKRAASDPLTVGFVGRVVAIKDVKCFIQAIKIASDTIPMIEAYVIGPTDEEPDYFTECEQLVSLLGVTGMVHFTGRANVLDYYPAMDVLALTSLSEGQPLVILEANCAGVPVVASDVGACRDLLEGITLEDQGLGPSGLLTLAASPDQTAQALIRLWKDEPLRQKMAAAGRERVSRFYRQDAMYAAYRDLYRNTLHRVETTGEDNLTWPA